MTEQEQEQWWYFTFGHGHMPGIGYYTKFYGTYASAREQMNAKYEKWAFQYESAEEAGVNRFNLIEVP